MLEIILYKENNYFKIENVVFISIENEYIIVEYLSMCEFNSVRIKKEEIKDLKIYYKGEK